MVELLLAMPAAVSAEVTVALVVTVLLRDTAATVETGGLGTTSPPARQPEETNGVALVSQQELDYNTKVSSQGIFVLYFNIEIVLIFPFPPGEC